eukprot:CAMPEP_0173393202 /NCGR_PEP_ID=MMETSP1356-20130122/21976_1 /TAXON_ID=77927 ORGANISM="Hemiselmis virescens, Strain PCC157" /NCGR_SAMPLE_ID=MMETSP1356 /ASSEMBLY_ACC=CAM_ASM_000847 /LENGTH=165 /DNA_ID=CAMNT_0014351187 /DNA_START=30 /DNA_END=527 /DNA_ORIENTATION=-
MKSIVVLALLSVASAFVLPPTLTSLVHSSPLNTAAPLRRAGGLVLSATSFSTVPAGDAFEKIQSEGYQYVDVRTEGEYKGGKVPGSILVPAFQMSDAGMKPDQKAFLAEFQKRFPDLDSKIVVSCASGKRSTAAAGWLCELGYSNVIEVAGGFGGWSSNKDLPTE